MNYGLLAKFSFFFTVVCAIAWYIIHWSKVVQIRVDHKYPGYKVYWNPIGIFFLWLLYVWINFSYKRGYSINKTPGKHWFPGCLTLEESGSKMDLSVIDYADALHPTFLGYCWYRSYSLETSSTVCLFFTPWVWPQESRTPVFLFKGDNPGGQIVWQFIWGMLFRL